MSKKPNIAMPKAVTIPQNADDFVKSLHPSIQEEIAPKEKPKRLTIDISANLHTEFKIAAMRSGMDMKDIMSKLISEYVSAKSAK